MGIAILSRFLRVQRGRGSKAKREGGNRSSCSPSSPRRWRPSQRGGTCVCVSCGGQCERASPRRTPPRPCFVYVQAVIGGGGGGRSSSSTSCVECCCCCSNSKKVFRVPFRGTSRVPSAPFRPAVPLKPSNPPYSSRRRRKGTLGQLGGGKEVFLASSEGGGCGGGEKGTKGRLE